jgi:ferredoxin
MGSLPAAPSFAVNGEFKLKMNGRQTSNRATFVTDRNPRICYNVSEAERGRSMEWAVPTINLERCDRCGRCVETCPTGAVEMRADGPVIVRPDDCTYCTDCESVCPRGAIRCPYEIVWDTGTS